jgi:ABC-type multidrug transport system fused ATPase/permease subunit
VIAEETFQSVNMVKSFTNENLEIKRYNIEIANVIQAAINAARYRGAFASFIIAALFGGIILVLWYGATLVSEGNISIGDLVTYLFYTIYIGASVGGMGEMYGQIQKAAGAAERVLSFMDEELEEVPGGNKKYNFKNGDILYNDVHFEYPGRKDFSVLKGISISIEKGQKVALVGKSGSGKSTITNLLSRFYSIEKGQISISGKNIEDITLNSLRKNIGIVPQEIILFGGSIRENILYGKPDASEEDIIKAAKNANAWDFISSFPEGLETTVGDRGIQLSGGQKQRIAIARTILKDPAILILDEATSSLDAVSEKTVQEAMDKLMLGRTSIIIAHRLSTVQNVDKIFVVMDGIITEIGKHHDLIAKEGNYHQLIKHQFSQESA